MTAQATQKHSHLFKITPKPGNSRDGITFGTDGYPVAAPGGAEEADFSDGTTWNGRKRRSLYSPGEESRTMERGGR